MPKVMIVGIVLMLAIVSYHDSSVLWGIFARCVGCEEDWPDVPHGGETKAC